MHKDGEGDYRGWRSKTLSEVRPVKNISKNLQSFLEICLMQKEVLLSQKLWDHAYEYLNPLRLKEDNFSKKLPEIVIQVCLTQSKNVKKVWIEERFTVNKFKWKPQIFRKLSFRELCDSKLSGLHAFDNMTIIHQV